MAEVDTAEEAIARRAPIADEYAKNENDIHADFRAAVKAAEDDREEALRANRLEREEAYVAAGLNPDGSDPQGREEPRQPAYAHLLQ